VPPAGLGKRMSAPSRAREGDGQVRLGGQVRSTTNQILPNCWELDRFCASVICLIGYKTGL